MGFQMTTKLIGFAATIDRLSDIKTAASGSVERQVGTDVEYAPHVEYGTSRMAAQPYMRPAADEANANVGTYIRRASSLDEAVELTAVAVEEGAKRRCPVDTGRLRASIRVLE